MENIIQLLPYQKPFLFVDEIQDISDDGVTGTYRLKHDEYFYEGHFPGNPITPGVIITEIMAQIGLVCLGIHLLSKQNLSEPIFPVFSNATVDFLQTAKPGDLLKVVSKKEYFRFSKLKCQVDCYNETTQQLIARGHLSGMILKASQLSGVSK